MKWMMRIYARSVNAVREHHIEFLRRDGIGTTRLNGEFKQFCISDAFSDDREQPVKLLSVKNGGRTSADIDGEKPLSAFFYLPADAFYVLTQHVEVIRKRCKIRGSRI